MEIITYHSTNAKPSEQWCAYCVGNDGEQILVRMIGSTEAEAIERANAWWNGEQVKWGKLYKQELIPTDTPAAPIRAWDNKKSEWSTTWGENSISGQTPQDTPPSSDGPAHGLAGKIWVANNLLKHKTRVDPSELDRYLANGYVKAGPRTQFE